MKTSTRRKAGPVSRAEFEALRERLEDLEDAMRIRMSEKETKPENLLPADLVDRMIAGESPVRIWREHRGMALRELARKADIPASYLSDIEHKKKPGSVAALSALAKALGVKVDDLT